MDNLYLEKNQNTNSLLNLSAFRKINIEHLNATLTFVHQMLSMIFKNASQFKLLSIYSFIILSKNPLHSQNINQSLIWYGIFTTYDFNKKWYFQNEFQERHFISPIAQHQFIVRSHVHRNFPKAGMELSAGASYFLQNSNNPNVQNTVTIPERRPHIELGKKHAINKIQFEHRFRTEARFYRNTNSNKTELEDGYYFDNFRFRFRSQISVPIVKINQQNFLKIKISDEIHLHSTKHRSTTYFDQNRVYVALNYEINKKANIEFGYLNWYQQKNATAFYNRNIARFTVFHKI